MAANPTVEGMTRAMNDEARDLAHYRELSAEYDRVRTEAADAEFRRRVSRGDLPSYIGGRHTRRK